MPAWSPEIANEFIRLARHDGRAFDQMQLQRLVYIAHGWCLADTGMPLTGDRPEAWSFGPVYRRIAEADEIASSGQNPVTEFIRGEGWLDSDQTCALLGVDERQLIAWVYREYGNWELSDLSLFTRHGNAPWRDVYADGAGLNKDISHKRIQDQFQELAAAA